MRNLGNAAILASIIPIPWAPTLVAESQLSNVHETFLPVKPPLEPITGVDTAQMRENLDVFELGGKKN